MTYAEFRKGEKVYFSGLIYDHSTGQEEDAAFAGVVVQVRTAHVTLKLEDGQQLEMFKDWVHRAN